MIRLIAATLVAGAMLLLGGCKMELYRGLHESEANQMLEILMSKGIPASKSLDKTGSAEIAVEETQFAEAVEVLRQNGFPRAQATTVAEIFPSSQLVSSPGQEKAKLIFAKEQSLQQMLQVFDGVIVARVSLAGSEENRDGTMTPPAASVYIKYSPTVNFRNYETDIRRLVMNSIPDMKPEQITVVMQPAGYRYIEHTRPSNALPWWIDWLRTNALLAGVVVVGIGALALLAFGLVYLRRQQRVAA